MDEMCCEQGSLTGGAEENAMPSNETELNKNKQTKTNKPKKGLNKN